MSKAYEYRSASGANHLNSTFTAKRRQYKKPRSRLVAVSFLSLGCGVLLLRVASRVRALQHYWLAADDTPDLGSSHAAPSAVGMA